MTLPQNVKDAVAQLDNAMMFHADDLSYASWTAIRAHLLSQDAEIERLESRLAAANALLRFMRTRFDAYMDDSDRASIDAAAQEGE